MTEYYPSKVCEVGMFANDVDLEGFEVLILVAVAGIFTGFSYVISAVAVGWYDKTDEPSNGVDLEVFEVLFLFAFAVSVTGIFTGSSYVISAVVVSWEDVKTDEISDDAFDDATVVTPVNVVNSVVVADDGVIIIDADPTVENFLRVVKPVEDNDCL